MSWVAESIKCTELMAALENGRVVGQKGDRAISVTGEPFQIIQFGAVVDAGQPEGYDDALIAAVKVYVTYNFPRGQTIYWRKWPEFETEAVAGRPVRRTLYMRLLISDKPIWDDIP